MLESFFEMLPEFLSDALLDSVKLVPFLLIIFIFIEIFENFFAHKITSIVSFSRKLGPLLGAGLALIPQCGFSVVMTTLFLKRYITIGTLISVYIATSDEAIPILLANPSEIQTVLKIIVIKFFLAVITGYIVDLFIKSALRKPHVHKETNKEHEHCEHCEKGIPIEKFEMEKGCCSHEISENKIKNIIFHPLKHTFYIFLFIFAVCICLNFMFDNVGMEKLSILSNQNSVLQTMFFAVFGLIPNCAVSVLITMMYLKEVISFGSVIAGLTSNAGLGLLVLFTKKNNYKVFLLIISILVIVGFCAGLIFLNI